MVLDRCNKDPYIVNRQEDFHEQLSNIICNDKCHSYMEWNVVIGM